MLLTVTIFAGGMRSESNWANQNRKSRGAAFQDQITAVRTLLSSTSAHFRPVWVGTRVGHAIQGENGVKS